MGARLVGKVAALMGNGARPVGGCRGGNLGPVWDYLANVGVPSGVHSIMLVDCCQQGLQQAKPYHGGGGRGEGTSKGAGRPMWIALLMWRADGTRSEGCSPGQTAQPAGESTTLCPVPAMWLEHSLSRLQQTHTQSGLRVDHLKASARIKLPGRVRSRWPLGERGGGCRAPFCSGSL